MPISKTVRQLASLLLLSVAGLGAAPARAALSVAAEINPDPAQPSELIDIQLTVASTAASGSLALRVLWPERLQGTSAITAGGSCPGGCDAGDLLTWNLGSLAAGANVVVGVNTLVSASATDGSVIPLQIELLEGGVSRVLFTRSIEVQAASPLELVLDPLTDPVTPGSVLVYELVYGNAGAASAENAQMSFPVPAGTQFLSATGNGVHAGGTITWNLGSVAPNDGGRERVTLQVNALASGSMLTVDAASVSGEINFLPRTSRARAVSRVVSGSSLQLGLEIGPDPAQPGELIDAQITITNPGGSATGLIEARLLWPEHLAGSTTITGSGSCPGGCDRGDYLSWSVGILGPGVAQTIAFSDFIGASTLSGTPIPFEIELFQAGVPVRTVSRTLLVQAASPLELLADPQTDPVAAGSVLVYKLTYGNAGTASANGAQLRFPLPAGTQFVSATGGGTHSAGAVSWNLGSIPPDGGGSRQVSVQVDTLPNGTLLTLDNASLSAEVDFLPRVTRARAISRVGSPTLELAAEINPEPVRGGELLDAQITIANPGANATGVLEVRLLWPEHLSGSTTITGGGSCPGGCDRGDYLFWSVGVLGPGVAQSIGFDDFIASATPSGTPIPFEIELFQGGLPVRTISRTLLAQTISPLELLVDPATDPIGAGDTLAYDLTYGNAGNAAVSGTQMRFPLPAGTQFVSATGGGTLLDGTVTWNLGTLPANGGGRERVSLQVAATGNRKLLVVDNATILGNVASQPHFARADAVSRIGAGALGLTSSITPNPVRPSQLISAQFGISNPTASATGTLTLRLLWPEHLNGSTTITGGGSCPGGCDRGDYLSWNLGSLGPGATANVGVTDSIASATVDGTLIPFEIELLVGGLPARTSSQTLLAHPATDQDTDGIANVFDPDDDNDGMPDWWELLYGFNPLNPADAGQDADGDGHTNLQEFLAGTNPRDDTIFRNGFQ